MEAQLPRSEGSRARPARPTLPSAPPSQSVQTYTDLQALHHQTYALVTQALTLDEEGREREAMAAYTQALALTEQLLAVDCERLSGSSPAETDAAKQMMQKVSKTKLQLQYRIQALQTPQSPPPPQEALAETMQMDQPPSYEEAMSASMSETEMQRLGDSIQSDESDSSNASLVANATRVFTVPGGVQIFFITPEGYVSAPSYPAALNVFRFNDAESSTTTPGMENPGRPPAFLQVGEWLYPLVPGMSPALRSSYGAYLFPDVASPTPDAAVGLMLPETLGEEERANFEGLLASLTNFVEQPSAPPPDGVATPPMEGAEARPQVPPPRPPPPQEMGARGEKEGVKGEKEGEKEGVKTAAEEERPSTSTRISRGILVAADYISWGMEKGAEQAGQLIKFGSTKLQQRLRPEARQASVDPKLQKGAQYARQATHVAVRVSSFLVSALSSATARLGREIAPHIRRHGEKLLPRSLSKDGGSKMDGVLEVAVSGLHGFGTVFMSLEKAAKVLGRNIANETVQVVNHKYGVEAGRVAENTLYSVGNVAMATYNVDNLGIKAVAKRAAKDTGSALLHDIKDSRSGKNGQVAAPSSQPPSSHYPSSHPPSSSQPPSSHPPSSSQPPSLGSPQTEEKGLYPPARPPM